MVKDTWWLGAALLDNSGITFIKKNKGPLHYQELREQVHAKISFMMRSDQVCWKMCASIWLNRKLQNDIDMELQHRTVPNSISKQDFDIVLFYVFTKKHLVKNII